MASIGVLGAGTWGIALARMLSVHGHDVSVWSALPEEIDEYIRTRVNPNLPDMRVPDEVSFTKDIKEICGDKDILLFAVPSVYVRSTAKAAAPYVKAGQIIVDVAKGLEPETLKTMTEVIAEEIDKPGCKYVALSGPTHAEEVAIDMPTCIVSACEDIDVACKVQDIFSNPVMRVYTNTDVKGVEICGALKNVIALAAGISAGLGYGDNARAGLMTRGLVEIKHLGLKMGCREETFSGLAGMGDLIVTATSEHSRNNRCGRLLGQGVPPDEAIRQVGMVVEGVNAIPAALELAERYGVEVPLVSAVAKILDGEDARTVANSLMSREKKSELFDPE